MKELKHSGWKLVPIEPTETMVVNGFESWPDEHFSSPEEWEAFEKMSGCQQAAHKARLCYAAMLAAAPAIPQAAGDAGRAASVAAAIHYPDCWDIAAYPTLESALSEVYAAFKCSECGVEWRPASIPAAAQPDKPAAFEAWAKRHHYDLTRCSHEPYAAYRSDLTNAALAGWRGKGAPQPDHYQQLLGVAYVVLGCLVANGVDIPERFLDAFSDPDSVENPLELLPCDFSPARAVRAAVEAAALTDEQREAIKYARSVMGSVSWETPDSIRAKAVLDALFVPAVATPPSVTIETAVGYDLDAIGNEWYMRRLVGESCDDYRGRIKDRIEEFKEWRAAKGANQ